MITQMIAIIYVWLNSAISLGIVRKVHLRCLGVSCFPDAGGRGVAALRPISKAELLLKVPKSALITTDSLLSRDETLSLALKAHPSYSSTQVDYAIWAAQKAVTKAKYEWEQAFTLMKELKLKPPLLTFRAWIWATGTALDLKPNYVRAWANMGISYANQV
ncbi:hypothetical protein ES332_A11G203100v1 [Gossypium tomentosum]|uniref:Protein SET DOMAIN GROUP 40-like n=1 Tax=Gossypium tomentosum TaxID=34277 RepID=A0A5D2NDQ5_GOSTO|nr:hypothetical protein ES332_A11G203100v1 [Gossypium tomentosum]